MNTETPTSQPLIQKSKEELIRIVEMQSEDLTWYVGERNRLLAVAELVVEKLRLEICCADLSAGAFICGVWGSVPLWQLQEIEKVLQSGNSGLEEQMRSLEGAVSEENDACMMITAVKIPAQIGTHGDVPRVELEEYWEFEILRNEEPISPRREELGKALNSSKGGPA